jgi:hypothetical protein
VGGKAATCEARSALAGGAGALLWAVQLQGQQALLQCLSRQKTLLGMQHESCYMMQACIHTCSCTYWCCLLLALCTMWCWDMRATIQECWCPSCQPKRSCLPTEVRVAYLAVEVCMEASVWGHAKTEVQQPAQCSSSSGAWLHEEHGCMKRVVGTSIKEGPHLRACMPLYASSVN